MSHRGSTGKGREEGMRKDGGDLRLDSTGIGRIDLRHRDVRRSFPRK